MRLSAEAGILSRLGICLYRPTARSEAKTSFPLLSVTTKEGAALNISFFCAGVSGGLVMQVFRPMREIGVSSSEPAFDSRRVSHTIAVMS
jgi:hypothetical protein